MKLSKSTAILSGAFAYFSASALVPLQGSVAQVSPWNDLVASAAFADSGESDHDSSGGESDHDSGDSDSDHDGGDSDSDHDSDSDSDHDSDHDSGDDSGDDSSGDSSSDSPDDGESHRTLMDLFKKS